ncbi:MAG: dienelactone hydrolase family protein [Neisseriaceae bacterium]|jgi:putative phosphoribosyl transferase
MDTLKNRVVNFTIDNFTLEGNLTLPDGTHGLIIFAHGSGSSRFSPRNNYVATELHKRGFATLLMDLLTENEDTDWYKRFDIGLIVSRLTQIVIEIRKLNEIQTLPIGLFGASTGAAASLIAAAKLPIIIAAVVSRGGRPDLAQNILQQVTAPTLLILGGKDFEVIKLNKMAFEKLLCIKQMEIVPSATHLFDEHGTLEQVAQLASNWFYKYMRNKNL